MPVSPDMIDFCSSGSGITQSSWPSAPAKYPSALTLSKAMMRRLLPMCYSFRRSRRPSVSCAGRPASERFQHGDFHGPDLHGPVAREHGTPGGERDGLLEVARLHHDEAEDHLLGLEVGAVRHHLVRAAHHLARGGDGLSRALEVALGFEVADPGHPGLEAVLRLLRSAQGLAPPFGAGP